MEQSLINSMVGVGFLMSVISLIFAWRSVKSAGVSAKIVANANRLSERNTCLFLYRALQAFHSQLRLKGSSLLETDIAELKDAANMSQFYLPASLVGELDAIVVHAHQYLEFHIVWSNAIDKADRNATRNARDSLLAVGGLLRERCMDCDQNMQQYLLSNQLVHGSGNPI